MGVSVNVGGIPKWFVNNIKIPVKYVIWGTPILGNRHISICIYIYIYISYIEYACAWSPFGDGSEPCSPSDQNRWDLWMFI